MIPYLIQLLVIGLLWVSLHCVGMCGPIVAGLVAADSDPEDDRPARRSARRVLAYQSGRALTYAALGAAAGLAGQAVNGVIHGIGDIAALAMGIALFGAGIWRTVGDLGVVAAPSGGWIGRKLGRAARQITRLVPARGNWRFALFGAVMGFLPCMLMFWVLGLAASTGNPLSGAGLMVGLVAMTTPVLLAAGTSHALATGWLRHYGDRLVGVALMVSGIWLALIGAAANGWIGHASLQFSVGEQAFRVMFW